MSRSRGVTFRATARRFAVRCTGAAAVSVAAWALFVAMVVTLALPAGAHAADDPTLGTVEVFRVDDWERVGVPKVSLAATVSYVGEECVIYVEKGRPVPGAFVTGLGETFDNQVYPRLTALLGSEPDPGVDGQGRVVIVLYDFGDVRVDGYFDPQDVDPYGPADPVSNRREMFALNLEALLPDVEQAAAASAHEFAHLVVYYRDYMLDTSPSRTYEGTKAPWVEEAVTTYAELAAGYPGPAAVSLGSFSHTPNENLTIWNGDLNDYGASYAFGVYLAERFGQEIITEIAAQPLDGVAGIQAVLQARGAFDTFDSIFDDWVVANALEGRPPETSLYAYGALDFVMELSSVDGPLPRVGTASVESFGTVYLDLPSTEAASVVRVVLDGEDGAPLRAALLSWDSTGLLPPAVEHVALTPRIMGGPLTSPPGYDRHTLAVWARGQEGVVAGFDFAYSAAVDPVGDIQFLDVGSDHRFFAYIDDLLARGVISGREVPKDSGLWYFDSNEYVLRAQFAKIAVESVGLHTEPVEGLDDPTFSDVQPSNDSLGRPLTYPFDYVEEAAAAGIVKGYSGGSFGPWEPIKRIQLVSMILRAAAAAGKPFERYTGSEAVFVDVPPGHPMYGDAMTAYSNGIMEGSLMEGTGVRVFSPGAPATRGHVAKMTANLIWGMEASPAAE